MPRGGRSLSNPASPPSSATTAVTPTPNGTTTSGQASAQHQHSAPQPPSGSGLQYPVRTPAASGAGSFNHAPLSTINMTSIMNQLSQHASYPTFGSGVGSLPHQPWISSPSGIGYVYSFSYAPTHPAYPPTPSTSAPAPMGGSGYLSYPSGSQNQTTQAAASNINGGQAPNTAPVASVPPQPQSAAPTPTMPPQTAIRGRGRGRGRGGVGRPRKTAALMPTPTLTSSTAAAPATAAGLQGGGSQPPPAHVSSNVPAAAPLGPLGPLLGLSSRNLSRPAMQRHRLVQHSHPWSRPPSVHTLFGHSAAQPPPASLLPPTLAKAPCPPNWAQSLLQATAQVTSPFLKFPVVKTSAEYATLSQMFGPTMGDVERVVNPELWKRFTRTRADLLTSKSDDLILLASLGLNEAEVAQRAHVSINFDKGHLNGSPYCDNVVLLFHGSRGHGSVDTILSQGLDERLGNTGGLMGRGIYFSDEPQKAMQYDTNGVLIVFAVMLGDCLAIPGGSGGAVREPEKVVTQKRNHQDLFFDSVVGCPTAVHNEYVVFNRAQCCPLYTISYNKWGQATPTVPAWNQTPTYGEHVEARQRLPSFAWGVGVGSAATAQTQSPFYARKIFSAMAADADDVGMETEDDEAGSSAVRRNAATTATGAQQSAMTNLKTAQELDEEESLAVKLSQLTELGFLDDDKNKDLLEQFGGNLETTIDYLLEEAAGSGPRALNTQATAAGPTPGTSASAITAMAAVAALAIPSTSTSSSGSSLTSPTPKIFSLYDTIDLTDTDEEQETTPALHCKLPRLGSLSTVTVAVPQNCCGGGGQGASSSKATVTATASVAADGAMEWLDSLLKDYDVSPKDMSMNAAGDEEGDIAGAGDGEGRDKSTGAVNENEEMDAEEEENAVTQPPPTPPPTEEECPICFVEYSLGPEGAADWQTLPCAHKICTACHAQMQSSGTTMSGQSHTFIKCPFCQACAGIQIGSCPDGSMTVLKLPTRAAGYPTCGSLSIRYYVHSGRYTLDRTAYLPDNTEGQRILALLRTAWDRRLCFTIGTSMTTGAKNVLVWNIHHKTALAGGTHGYPDPTYLQRVAEELMQYGIQ